MMAEQIAGYAIPSMVEFFRRHGLDQARIDALVARGNGYKRGVPEIPATFHRLFADQLLKIGDHDWRTMVGHGHAPEHMSLYCAELGVLISGDMLLPRISTNISVMASNPLGDPLGLFLASIDGFRALPEDTLVLPSHGRPFRGLHARVEQLHAHHAERCEVLLTACKGTPRTAADLIAVLFNREIPDPHQTMFAMGEAIAHLNYLEHAGKMQRIEENGLIRFVSS
jgi:glyoxylase-like metal-dependent hydrolase (beta-lactamase superfamily II)